MAMLFRLQFFLATFLLFTTTYAQDRTIDSLKIVLENPALHDTTRIRAISDAMDANYHDNYDKNYLYLNDMIGRLALKNYNKKNTPALRKLYAEWLATYYSGIAADYAHNKINDKALMYHGLAIETLRAVKSYDEMYVSYLNKAQFYTLNKEEDKAIPLIFSALKYFEGNKQRYAQQLPYALTMLSHVYREQQQWENSIKYSQNAIEYYDISYSKNPINHTLSLKATSYSNIANAYSKLKNYSKTLEYAEKALTISRKIKSNAQTGLILARIADTNMKLSNFTDAEAQYREVLEIKGLAPNSITVAVSNLGLGIVSFKQGDLSMATIYAEKAFDISKKTANVALQKDVASLLYDINIAKKDYEKAHAIYRFNEKISDSSQIQSSRNELAQQILKYDFEKKELQQRIVQNKKVSELKLESEKKAASQKSQNKLTQQKLVNNYEKKQLRQKIEDDKRMLDLKLEAEKKTAAKNNWLIALSGILAVLILAGVFYKRYTGQKEAISALEKNQIKQKLLITQMNPHFIFNSVQNIRALINNSQNNQAVDYLDKFSKLTRQILENSNENYISLEEEVEMIQNYLSIQQLLYENKFNYTVRIESDLQPESIFLPPMLAQPFIENAIKHGLGSITKNGLISVIFYLKEHKLFFEVTDNGKGFDAEKKVGNHKSLAMTITKERLITYKKDRDFVVKAHNVFNADGALSGAKVAFEIPYIYEN